MEVGPFTNDDENTTYPYNIIYNIEGALRRFGWNQAGGEADAVNCMTKHALPHLPVRKDRPHEPNCAAAIFL